jgi:hypothetical protein
MLLRLLADLTWNRCLACAERRISPPSVADGVWSIYFGTVLLGRLDERTYTIYG